MQLWQRMQAANTPWMPSFLPPGELRRTAILHSRSCAAATSFDNPGPGGWPVIHENARQSKPVGKFLGQRQRDALFGSLPWISMLI
jgi:hypothetical protein